MSSGLPLHVPVGVAPAAAALRFTGFALSGGGAKGSFQVGALKYLMRGKGVKPDILTCTSVGAVNGLKLAEGDRPQTSGRQHLSGLDGLEQIWLNLRWPGDMYAPSQDVASLGVDAYNGLDMLVGQAASNLLQQLGGVLLPVGAFVTFLGPLGWLLSPFVNTGPVEDLVKSLISLAADADSLFTLDPIAGILEGGALNPVLVETSGISLALATVALTTGELRYIRLAKGLNHQHRLIGYLVERNQLSAPAYSAAQVGAPIDMRDAMLASAAAPMFFAPQRLKMSGSAVQELYTDGGVRELVPVQAALDLGARRVFALDCNAPLNAPGTNWPHPGPSEPAGLLSLSLRVLAEMLEEIDYDDTLAPAPERARFWHVRPRFEVEGDMEIDPGAIRVNIDYGYMCAFDAIDGSVRTATRRALLQSLGQRIAVLRRDISDRERCVEWAVHAIEYQRNKGGGAVTLEELVNALDYHRYPGDKDMGGRKSNLMADLGLCGSHLDKDEHVVLSVGIGQGADNDLDLDLSRKRWPTAADNLSAKAAALRILQALKCQLQTLYDARSALAGVTAVPPNRHDATQMDRPWLRWEQPFSQRFFGNVWPSGFDCTATLDEVTQLEVIARQVERRGTSGWALLADGYGEDHMPLMAQILAADGSRLQHLYGAIETSDGSPWAPNPGAKWRSTWGVAPQTPLDLGMAIVSVSACWVTENDYVSLQALARLAGSGSAGDTLTELTYDPHTGWTVLGPVVADGAPLIGVTGNPVLLEAIFAQEESFELLVPIGPRIAHYHRNGRSGAWASRGSGAAYTTAGASGGGGGESATSTALPLSITCIQSNYGVPANMEAVVAVGSATAQSAPALVALYYDAENEQWNETGPIAPAGVDLSSITGDPVLFQSRFGRQGDFELFVPAGQRVLHLFRDNDNGMKWGSRGSGVVYDGGPMQGNGGHHPNFLRPSPVAIACWQSICGGHLGNPDFHAILRTRSPWITQGGTDGFLALRFDRPVQQWVIVDEVSVGGQPFTV